VIALGKNEGDLLAFLCQKSTKLSPIFFLNITLAQVLLYCKALFLIFESANRVQRIP